MKILTKRQAESAILNSLFQAGGTLACLPKERLDRGKYKDTIFGKEVPPHLKDRVHLVWAERRKDKDGPYFALFCISRPDDPAIKN
jgi:hypothetical protein